MDRGKVKSGGHSPARRASLFARALSILDAVDLIRLGARIPLICKLTGLELSTAKRLYRQIRGFHAPAGQAPFTDTWYLKSHQRMLHTTIIWRLFQAFEATSKAAARALIDIYGSYTQMVQNVLLDITRAAFVPQLVAQGLWLEYRCEHCSLSFIGPDTNVNKSCPACHLYHRFRCRLCCAAIEQRSSGRNRDICASCSNRRKRQKSS